MPKIYPYAEFKFDFDAKKFAKLAATALGEALWGFLTEPRIILMMEHGVRHGRSPVAEISGVLLDEFGLPDAPGLTERDRFHRGLEQKFGASGAGDPRIRQMIGTMVRQILELIGCPMCGSDVPARDQWHIFTTSARYRHPDPAPGSRPAIQAAADMRQAVLAAFKELDAEICERKANWHVHGPDNPPKEGNCNNHPLAIHKNDPHGVLVFRDEVWPADMLGAVPRPANHKFGRMALIADAAAIQGLGGPVPYAAAVVAELRRLKAW